MINSLGTTHLSPYALERVGSTWTQNLLIYLAGALSGVSGSLGAGTVVDGSLITA